MISRLHGDIFKTGRDGKGRPIGKGNNPMVGATVAVAVAVEEAMGK